MSQNINKIISKLNEIKAEIGRIEDRILNSSDVTPKNKTTGYVHTKNSDETWCVNHILERTRKEKIFINGYKRYPDIGILAVYSGDNQNLSFYELGDIDIDSDISELTPSDFKEIEVD